jgi:hypothetical protein
MLLNPLFRSNYSQSEFESFIDEISHHQLNSEQQVVQAIQDIGLNGIVAALNNSDVIKELSPNFIHQVGEEASKFSSFQCVVEFVIFNGPVNKFPIAALIHGAAWEHLKHLNATVFDSGQLLWREIDILCDDLPTPQAVVDCLHGVGHGFRMKAMNETDATQSALNLCSLGADRNKQYVCASGVFMESEGTGEHDCCSYDYFAPCFRFARTPAFTCAYIDQAVHRGCLWGSTFTANHASDEGTMCQELFPSVAIPVADLQLHSGQNLTQLPAFAMISDFLTCVDAVASAKSFQKHDNDFSNFRDFCQRNFNFLPLAELVCLRAVFSYFDAATSYQYWLMLFPNNEQLVTRWLTPLLDSDRPHVPSGNAGAAESRCDVDIASFLPAAFLIGTIVVIVCIVSCQLASRGLCCKSSPDEVAYAPVQTLSVAEERSLDKPAGIFVLVDSELADSIDDEDASVEMAAPTQGFQGRTAGIDL